MSPIKRPCQEKKDPHRKKERFFCRVYLTASGIAFSLFLHPSFSSWSWLAISLLPLCPGWDSGHDPHQSPIGIGVTGPCRVAPLAELGWTPGNLGCPRKTSVPCRVQADRDKIKGYEPDPGDSRQRQIKEKSFPELDLFYRVGNSGPIKSPGY